MTGLERSDGMLFGEWARQRTGRLCPGYPADKLIFQAAAQGPFGKDGVHWEVYINIKGGTPIKGGLCPGMPFNLAYVRGADGVLKPMRAANTGSVTLGLDSSNTPVSSSTDGPGWLDEFRSGATP